MSKRNRSKSPLLVSPQNKRHTTNTLKLKTDNYSRSPEIIPKEYLTQKKYSTPRDKKVSKKRKVSKVSAGPKSLRNTQKRKRNKKSGKKHSSKKKSEKKSADK